MKINFKKFQLWPRTLSMQLILVTVAGVVFSNVAVAYWFEYVNEQQSENFFVDRLIGRSAQLAGSLSAIAPDARMTVTRYASLRPLSFNIRNGTVPVVSMNAEEKALAARVTESLPLELAKHAVTVQRATVDARTVRRGGRGNGGGNRNGVNAGPTGNGGSNFAGGAPPSTGNINFSNPPNGAVDPNRTPQMAQVVDVAVQIDAETYLMARSTRFEEDGPSWPIQNRIATLLSIMVTSAGAGLLARRMSKPLSKLTDAASEVAKGGAAPRVPEEGPDDVRKAAVAFNAMTDQVQRTLASQRQLLTAVGHDLRTPITAMRITMEFVDDEDTRERLEKNLNELQALTEAVLSAAKGAGGEPKRNVDVGVLLDSLCADLEDMEKPVTWESHGPAPLFCRPNEITRAARNLIENAIAYGKNARVRLEDSRDQYEIVVEDDGPGIPDADRDRVFEPFVRLETSRNLETGGTGLGLTLVKAIAEGHGGSVHLENRPEGGLTVRMRLPRGTVKA